MKKYFKILLNVLILNFLIINPINSKTLPPGTGGEADVPANVLILLDVSGSMSERSGRAVAPIPNTDSVLTLAANKIKKVNQVKKSLENIHPSRSELSHNQNEFSLMDNAKKVVYHDGRVFTYDNSTKSLYQYDVNRDVQSNVETIGKVFSHMFLNGNDLVLINHVDTNYYVKDLNAPGGDAIECQVRKNSHLYNILNEGKNYTHPNFAFNVDSSGNLIAVGSVYKYISWNYGYRWQAQLYKFRSNGTCFNTSYSESYYYTYNSYNYPMIPSSVVGHPTNRNEFFLTDINNSKLSKISVSGGRISFRVNVGKLGSLPTNYNPTRNKNDIKFNNPYHIAIEKGKSRVYVADYVNQAVQSFDFNLNFKNVTRFENDLSRMEGAKQAIQSIVTDSSLISSVNFGYGIWSDYSIPYIAGWRFSWNGISSVSRSEAINTYGMEWLKNYTSYSWRNVLLYSFIRGMPPSRFPGFERWDNSRDRGYPSSNLGGIEVKVNRDGAAKINTRVVEAQPMLGTNANFFATLAKEYFEHPTESPIDPNSDCQGNYIIVIGDGEFTSGSTLGFKKIEQLAKRKNSPVKTIPIAYGSGIKTEGLAQFNKLAIAGGTGNAIVALNPASLKARITEVIRNIQADKLAFTAPAITAKVGEGGFLYQAQFQYRQKKEWLGSLSATSISEEGELEDDITWEAARLMALPSSRKIWTVLPSADYNGNWNNFTETNSILINEQFESLGIEVGDYHNDGLASGTGRCSNLGDSRTTIQNGNSDDVKGLISFIRGEDYFDYDNDCLLNEPRLDDNGQHGYLGDIYHSELVVVGPPSANTNYLKKNEEAYFRSLNNYQAFKQANENRDKTIYVGANDGMLHAFNADTG